MMSSPPPRSSRSKKHSKADELHWECSVCTYQNAPEAFKCSMCDVRKGTSTRKPKVNNVQLAAASQVAPACSTKSTRRDDDQRERTDTNSRKRKRLRRSWKPFRLKNVDRTNAEAREITINDLTIEITEFKPKDKRNPVDQFEPSSSEMSNQSESSTNL